MIFPLYDRNPHTRFPLVTLLLIAANVVCFWQSISSGTDEFARVVYQRGFVPARLTNLDQGQPVVVEQELDDGRPMSFKLSTDPARVYPTMLTMMFLHGGWLHLLSNMWMLWVFGDNVEAHLGRIGYLLFYLAAGLIAVLTHWLSAPDSTQPVIGASGAVAGVLGAYAVTYPAARVKSLLFIGIPLLIDLPSAVVLGLWLVMQLVGVFLMMGAPGNVEASIAFWAHIGGFLAGVVCMPLLTLATEPPGEDWRAESKEMFDL